MSDSSGSGTSQELCGHHETWDDIVDNQAKQIKKLEKDVRVANERLEHALWHCHVYRHSLSKLPGGYEQHKKSLAEHEEELEVEPLCSQCERDGLLKKIADLEERLRSATGK